MPLRRQSTAAFEPAKGPHGGRPRGRHIKVWVTPEEETLIAEQAAQAGLKHSAYLRALGLNTPLRSVLDLKAVGALAQVNGELGRTADLLKQWLTGGSEEGVVGGKRATPCSPFADVRVLVQAFRRLQAQIHEIAGRVLRP